MKVNIQIKRSTGTTAPSSLADGELRYTHGTGTQGNNGDRLFIGDGSTVNVIGGQYFAEKLDHIDGTLTASSAIIMTQTVLLITSLLVTVQQQVVL